MKKFSILLVMISLFTGFTTAQIQMESFDLPTLQTTTKRPVFFTKRGTQNVIISMYNMESFVSKTPQINPCYTLHYSRTLLKIFVQIDSSLYKLDVNSYVNIDRDWIQCINVTKKSEAKDIYGYDGENGIVVYRLYEKYKDDFLNSKMATNPIKIRQVN